MELRTRPGHAVVAAGVVFAALLLAGVPGGVAQATQPGESAGGRSGAVKTVTLVTGDRVLVDGAGQVTGVERSKGRERMPFSVRVVAGHTQVVPGDAELLLAQGKLDARLFDVTQLVADGYDDAGRSDLPLIVTFRGKNAPSMSPFTGAGARIGVHFPSSTGRRCVPSRSVAPGSGTP
ncbi:hypothetical protein [Streptomyces sp. NPDC002845]